MPVIDVAAIEAKIAEVRALDWANIPLEQARQIMIEVEELERFMASYGRVLCYRPNPKQALFHNPPGRPLPRVRLFLGGNRCLGGETIIPDPFDSSVLRRVEDIHDSFFVNSWNGETLVPALAQAPFVKGVDDLHEIEFSNGKTIVATLSHMLLTPSGFRSIAELHVGSEVCGSSETGANPSEYCNASGCEEASLHSCCATEQSQSAATRTGHTRRIQHHMESLAQTVAHDGGSTSLYSLQQSVFSRLQSTLGISLSTLPQGAWHYFQTRQGSIYCCQTSGGSYGVLFPQGEEGVLDVFPLHTDALGHNHNGSLADGLAYEEGCTRSYRQAAHPSTSGDPSPCPKYASDAPCHTSQERQEFSDLLSDELRHSAKQFRLTRGKRQVLLPTDILSSTSSVLRVVSKKFLRHDKFYDFTVPIYHNYQDNATVISRNSGKTHALVCEAFSFAIGERMWDGTKIPVRVPNRGRFIVTSYLDGGRKVLDPKIREIFPPELIKSTKQGQQGNVVEVKLTNGSWFDVVSTEQESMKHEGADLDCIAVDEPLPRDHWIANWRGLTDRSGYAFMSLTPLSEPWIKQELYDRALFDENYYVVQASTRENVGYGLTTKAVDDFESALSEDEKSVRIEGNFMSLTGMVYKEYRDQLFPDGHLVEPFEIPADWPRYCGIDPHDRTPTHAVWMAVSPEDDVYVYDEMAIGEKTVKEISDEIKRKEELQSTPPSKIIRIIDPASARESNVGVVGQSISQEFTRNGIFCLPANNDIIAGHKKMREFLIFKETLRGKRPRMFIFSNMKIVRRSIINYIYDDRSIKGAAKDYRDPKENRVREKEKHGVDCCRYILMFNPRYIRRDRDDDSRGYVANNETTGY